MSGEINNDINRDHKKKEEEEKKKKHIFQSIKYSKKNWYFVTV